MTTAHHFMSPLEQRVIRTNGIRINTWLGGGGAPVLLHGYPQTGQMWRKVAPKLAGELSVVCPDLRGYGDSDKPRDGYDKRTMERDVHLLMESLGHRTYAVVGHDRGARVSHRLALDFPGAVSKLCVLDTWKEKAERVDGHPLPCGISFRKKRRTSCSPPCSDSCARERGSPKAVYAMWLMPGRQLHSEPG